MALSKGMWRVHQTRTQRQSIFQRLKMTKKRMRRWLLVEVARQVSSSHSLTNFKWRPFVNIASNGEHQDTYVGRVYSYDSTFKLLILSKSFCHKSCDSIVIETVVNPGTPDEAFADSLMINARNIKQMEPIDTEPSATESLNGTEITCPKGVQPVARVGNS